MHLVSCLPKINFLPLLFLSLSPSNAASDETMRGFTLASEILFNSHVTETKINDFLMYTKTISGICRCILHTYANAVACSREQNPGPNIFAHIYFTLIRFRRFKVLFEIQTGNKPHGFIPSHSVSPDVIQYKNFAPK